MGRSIVIACMAMAICYATYWESLATIPVTDGQTSLAVKSSVDLNGDGRADIIWRNPVANSSNYWLSNGSSWLSNSASYDSGSSPGNNLVNWQIAGWGDFDKDGKSDIIWRNQADGSVSLWLMNGRSVKSSKYVGSVSSEWRIQGVGDFNGDGQPHMLWRNKSDNRVVMWIMNGEAFSSARLVSTVTDQWQVAGINDIDGDTRSDILWRNTSTGKNLVWFMSGAEVTRVGMMKTAATSWQVIGLNDFNSDSQADILWRNFSDGKIVLWLMSGESLSSWSVLATVSHNTVVASTDDINGDGNADILWRDKTTGKNRIWYMNGKTRSSLSTMTDKDVGWQNRINSLLWGYALSSVTSDDLTSVATDTAVRPDIVEFYKQWPSTAAASGWPSTELSAIDSIGAIPCITWEPMSITSGVSTAIPYSDITGGEYDTYIEYFAQQAKSYDKPVIIRFAHEMNLSSYHWGTDESSYGNASVEHYKNMHRYIVDIFRKNGANNALWAFSPGATSWPDKTWNSIANYYPGHDYVDIIGLDGYNWGTVNGNSWKSFEDIFSEPLAELRKLSVEKPVFIFETASAEAGGDKDKWIQDALYMAPRMNIQAIIWFQIDKETDWRINSSGFATYAQYVRMATDPLARWMVGKSK